MDHPLFTIIFGPTATGKSARAYELARRTQANILSFDSRQLYQGMGVVTGQDKPGTDFTGQIFGYNLVPPDTDFSIRHYYEYAAPIIADHRQRQQPVVLVGGSWPYAKVLIEPPATLFVPVNSELRQQLNQFSIEELQSQLQTLAPEKWSQLNQSDQSNPRRLIRAIEVSQAPDVAVPVPCIYPNEFSLVLHTLPWETIKANIAQRISMRLEEGALEETQALINKYPDWHFSAFSATGYHYLADYLQRKITLDECKQLWQQQEEGYAKRQLTWLNSIQAKAAKN